LISVSYTGLILERYNEKGEIEFSSPLPFPYEHKYKIKSPILIDGKLAIGRNDNLYFAFIRFGLLLSYSKNVDLRFFVKTMDRVPLPKLKEYKNVILIAPKSSFTSLSISVSESKIYLLSSPASREKRTTVIDVYNAINGKYLFSFKIPQKGCIFFSINENFFYTIGEGIVTAWEYVTNGIK